MPVDREELLKLCKSNPEIVVELVVKMDALIAELEAEVAKLNAQIANKPFHQALKTIALP